MVSTRGRVPGTSLRRDCPAAGLREQEAVLTGAGAPGGPQPGRASTPNPLLPTRKHQRPEVWRGGSGATGRGRGSQAASRPPGLRGACCRGCRQRCGPSVAGNRPSSHTFVG